MKSIKKYILSFAGIGFILGASLSSLSFNDKNLSVKLKVHRSSTSATTGTLVSNSVYTGPIYDPKKSFDTKPSTNFMDQNHSIGFDDRVVTGKSDDNWAGDFMDGRRGKVDNWRSETFGVGFGIVGDTYYDGINIPSYNSDFPDDSLDYHRANHSDSWGSSGWYGTEAYMTNLKSHFSLGTYGAGVPMGAIKGLAMRFRVGRGYSDERDWWLAGHSTIGSPINNSWDINNDSPENIIRKFYDNKVASLPSNQKIVDFRITDIDTKVWYHSDTADDASLDNIKYGFTFKYKYKIRTLHYTELLDVAKMIFSPLVNSSQDKDYSKNGTYWVDRTSPPAFHMGLNNTLFKAYEMKDWIYKQNKIIPGLDISNKQKDALKLLLSDHKIDDKNWDSVIDKFKNNINPNPEVREWATYYDRTKHLLPSGKNILDWLLTPTTYNNVTMTNYSLLSSFLSNTKLSVDYSINGSTNAKTMQVNANQYTDFKIDLKNSSANTASTSSIKINSLKIIYDKSNVDSNGVPKTQSDVVSQPFNLTEGENFAKYRILYNPTTHTYSAFYQPNPLNISGGIFLYPLDSNHKKYDEDLDEYTLSNNTWIKTGNKAYEGFIYKDTINGKQVEVPFYKNGKSNDIKTWLSTSKNDYGNFYTLQQFLTGKQLTFEQRNVTYALKERFKLVINPYSTTVIKNGLKIYDHPSWEINTVEDVIDGKDVTLKDFTSQILSNSFNKSFGMDRMGFPNQEGILGNGEHHIRINLKNRPQGSRTYNFIINNKTPNVRFENEKDGDKNYFYEQSGNFYPLHISNRSVNINFENKAIKRGKLSWVDTTGKWYEKTLDVKTKVSDQLTQNIKMLVDYQGLFKIEITDLAGNTSTDFLWIQDGEDHSIIAQPKLLTNANNIVASRTNKFNSTFWINDSSSSPDLLLANVISKGVTVRALNNTTGEMEDKDITSNTTYTAQKTQSIGSTIGSRSIPHSLAGDELSLIVDSSIRQYTIPGGRMYKQASINIPPGEYWEISINSGIYTRDNDGSYIPKTNKISVLNNSVYSLPGKLKTTKTDTLKLTHYNPSSHFDEHNIHKASSSEHEDIVDIGENKWRKVSKNFDTKIIIDFIKEEHGIAKLKIEWSPLWNEWYEPENVIRNKIILDKEGKYKITFTDKLNQEHHLNYLVFDYPRDFTKYITRTTIVDNGKTSIETTTFYTTSGVASVQESSRYHLSGEFTWNNSNALPKWTDSVTITPKSYYYDFSQKMTAVDINALKAKLGNVPSWVTISSESHDVAVSNTKTEKEFLVSGTGVSRKPLPLFIANSTTYAVEGEMYSNGVPQAVPTSVSLNQMDGTSALTDSQLMETAYFDGDYIDVYRESGGMEGLLVDDDDDDNTAKVHLLEDYDHYKSSLAEWIANNGTKDGFFESKLHHDGNKHIKSHGEDSQNNKAEGNNKSFPWWIFGVIIGIGALGWLGILAFWKYKDTGFGKTGKKQPLRIIKGKKNNAKYRESR